MSWEIERRFLVRVPEDAWATYGPGRSLKQGYVVPGPVAVRIRTGEARGPVLTCKQGSGIRRREVEEVVSREMAEALFQAAGDRVVEKVRHRVGPWELDRFQGSLAGLALLEIELEAEDDALPDAPASVSILREVTHDNGFTSSTLASMTSSDQKAWVRDIYAEVEG